ncbi:hypothetical protein M413DRAFT_301062 [Hebeloma cylindrosporum]|uniref:Uncharacterized protein n=1 Tax=Hebeloma cylindrosporum TaxID=76867 RepID=A0A0C2Y859_HEBCY|nr:hypothetical protein M413DRAFT_301062 [Hebeloma cylindrosporum h7]
MLNAWFESPLFAPLVSITLCDQCRIPQLLKTLPHLLPERHRRNFFQFGGTKQSCQQQIPLPIGRMPSMAVSASTFDLTCHKPSWCVLPKVFRVAGHVLEQMEAVHGPRFPLGRHYLYGSC